MTDTPPVDAQPVEPLTAEELAEWQTWGHLTDAEVARLWATLDAARAGDGLLRGARQAAYDALPPDADDEQYALADAIHDAIFAVLHPGGHV